MSIISRLCPLANEVREWKIGPSEMETSKRARGSEENELVAREEGRESGRKSGREGYCGTRGVEGRTGREQSGCQATDIVPIVAGVA